MNPTQFERHLTDIEMNLTQFEGHLTHFERNLTQFEGHPTQIDECVNNFVEIKTKLANAFASTFAIFPVPAHSPIAKELAKPPLFCLAGNLVILPKKN